MFSSEGGLDVSSDLPQEILMTTVFMLKYQKIINLLVHLTRLH